MSISRKHNEWHVFVILLIGVVILAKGISLDSQYVQMYRSEHKLALVYRAATGVIQDCEFFGDEKISDEVEAEHPMLNSELLSSVEFTTLVDDCQTQSKNKKEKITSKHKREIINPRVEGNREKTTNPLSTILRGIFPGTKWCGLGNIAESENDLGVLADVDRCCRSHDSCDTVVKGSTCIENLCNQGSITVSSCECDTEFRSCLTNVSSEASKLIGQLYFDVFNLHCIRQMYPIAEKICIDRGWFGWCREWRITRNTSQPMEWEFYDQPDY